MEIQNPIANLKNTGHHPIRHKPAFTITIQPNNLHLPILENFSEDEATWNLLYGLSKSHYHQSDN